jgi:hypothetical protein
MMLQEGVAVVKLRLNITLRRPRFPRNPILPPPCHLLGSAAVEQATCTMRNLHCSSSVYPMWEPLHPRNPGWERRLGVAQLLLKVKAQAQCRLSLVCPTPRQLYLPFSHQRLPSQHHPPMLVVQDDGLWLPPRQMAQAFVHQPCLAGVLLWLSSPVTPQPL